MQRQAITPALAIGDQPTAADLEELKREGYAGVVNVRQDGEPDQPLSPAEEGRLVRASGMDYLHSGVGGAPLSEAGVGAVCDFLDRHAADKVLVHCRRGPRAAALVLLHRARAEGWPPEEVVARGARIGLKVEGGLRQMVEAYLAARPSGA
jgi:uncharacterized protein (TIGR01244 family)